MKMEKSTLLHLPLQYFADGGDGAAATGGEAPASGGGETATQPSFDDMLKANKEMQSEFDKRMAKAQETALTKAKAEWEAEAQAKADEAAKLAKMTADEKAKHEFEKQKKAMADREANVTKRELIAAAKEQLTGKGLPAELAKCLDYSSADNCKASMEAVEKAFGAAVDAAVNERLKGSVPKFGAPSVSKDIAEKTLI